jgi:hypothetical protein
LQRIARFIEIGNAIGARTEGFDALQNFRRCVFFEQRPLTREEGLPY